MATTTPVVGPIGIHRPSHLGRWALVVAVLLAGGIGAGMIMDSGRDPVSTAAPATEQSQLSNALRLQEQADMLLARQAATQPTEALSVGRIEALRAQGAALARSQGVGNPNEFAAALAALGLDRAEALAVIEEAQAHGGFYDAASGYWVAGERPEPAVIAERGDFTAFVGPVAEPVTRFGGLDANLDPDVTVGNLSFEDYGFGDAGYAVDDGRVQYPIGGHQAD